MKLIDPSKAAYEIVEVLGDVATRRDGARLTLANKNAWYVLATIHGEPKESASHWGADEEADARNLAAANRQVWNRWQCRNLGEEMREARAEMLGLGPEDFAPFTKEELTALRNTLRGRMGDEHAELPSAKESINFSDVYFPKRCNFERFIFEESCVCIGAHFEGPSDFGRAHFFGNLNFSKTYFGGSAHFHVAHFDRRSDFDGVYFADDAAFTRAHFVGPTEFSKAHFVGNIFFNGTHFADYAVFIEASFSMGAKFASTVFKSETFFLDARFYWSVPEFHGAELFEKTLFPTNANDDGNWPPRDVDENKSVGQMPLAEQAFAYNRLQKFMNENMRIDEEQFFHRMEMRCKGKIGGRAYGLMHRLFDAVSEYGNSVWKPVSWLLVLIAAGAAAMLFYLEMGEPATGEQFWTSFGWSISNMLPFLGVGKLYYGAEFAACMPVWLKVLGGVQTLLGFILLFLLGLGLRNRFRLR